MADKDQENSDGKPSGPSTLMWLIILLVLSVAAAGAGGGLGIAIYAMAEKSAMAKAETAAEAEKVEHYAAGEQVYTLPPVVTNLAKPRDTWVRLEGSVVFKSRSEESRDGIVQIIGGDVMAYLRTLKLSQITGGTGLLHLREDLNERVQLRTGGEATEIVIHMLVVE